MTNERLLERSILIAMTFSTAEVTATVNSGTNDEIRGRDRTRLSSYQ